ncbi:cytochrome c oxidase assembly protein [Coniochaeta sp. PMI_546]|nr:cytochrome c oxidase assembly protein [Coniochaeta sp. PMI_546]
MSRASRLTLLGTSLFAAGTVFFVHFQQQAEKAAMHEGVVRDLEQQRIKRERQLDFDMQRQLEAQYKQDQSVHTVTEIDDRKDKAAAGGGMR